jgi:hypothetical protein
MATATLTDVRKTLTLTALLGTGYKPREYCNSKVKIACLLNSLEGTEKLIVDQILYTTEWLIVTGRLDGLVTQSVNKTDFKKYIKLVVLPAYKECVKQNWYCSGDMHSYVKNLLLQLANA